MEKNVGVLEKKNALPSAGWSVHPHSFLCRVEIETQKEKNTIRKLDLIEEITKAISSF